MESTTLVYGVFRSADTEKLISSLKGTGLEDITVITERQAHGNYRSAVVDFSPFKSFKVAGAAGAVIGGLAGAVASPTVPYGGTFQILTPLMAAISGAVVLAYFFVWTCGFLHGVDKPLLDANVFEGKIENGDLLIAIRVETREQKLLAMRCLEESGAIELIVKAAYLAPCEFEPLKAAPSGTTDTKSVAMEIAA